MSEAVETVPEIISNKSTSENDSQNTSEEVTDNILQSIGFILNNKTFIFILGFTMITWLLASIPHFIIIGRQKRAFGIRSQQNCSQVNDTYVCNTNNSFGCYSGLFSIGTDFILQLFVYLICVYVYKTFSSRLIMVLLIVFAIRNIILAIFGYTILFKCNYSC